MSHRFLSALLLLLLAACHSPADPPEAQDRSPASEQHGNAPESVSPAVSAAPATAATVEMPATGKTAGKHGSDRIFSAAGLYMEVPPKLLMSEGFDRSYLIAPTWKLLAPARQPGHTLLQLTLPKSNAVATAQLRIGASMDTQAMAQCLDAPGAGGQEKPGQVVLDGVPFTTWRASGAAMGHFFTARSYRARHAGRCYAIDLLVTGNSNAAMDQALPRPFTEQVAFLQLQMVLRKLRFADGGPSASRP